MSVFIVGAKRTAFGTFGGAFKDTTATELAVHAAKGAVAACGVDVKKVDNIVVGNVVNSSKDGIYMARHVGLHTGLPIEAPSLLVNRLCGSGFESIVQGTHSIQRGESKIMIAGGSENMSQVPYSLRNARFGTRFGQDLVLEDTLWAGLSDSYCGLPMALTAENLAEKYNISRRECDEWAVRSQQTWNTAQEAGHFKDEIVPVELKSRKGLVSFEVDEHPKTTSTVDKLSAMKPVFKKDGVVTAANASGICDGAAALVLAGEDAIKSEGLTPLVRIVSSASVGVPPEIMGIGPVPAIQAALKSAGLTMNDMDLVEINEAFASQYLACQKELGYSSDIANTCGGAIALGHPLGASGARIMAHLTHKLIRTGGKYAVGAACIGGGQGIAVIIERA
ncbi:3-ketoacyl-CoA thiolase, mitochondrial [Sphaeroforma arctica JP610]|uniref:3-ketoacyl-CoA thiolase, mitochondrial n=1 Tax=Sphaeroforma arctica JP610 TaxID=667725 RepID=A0A0L0G0N2_9EUKA|nr:3-ketoacyl-CoA thiolase, mitochondrial [Sphaeroforma arctica JP610]KNC82414.1 3-ketoacyl-CoA thiolase, mitochondrial [Sphaeroforma arctica JP610]|eukprot:XP_014156316.1 3-ketoacyl-CoA thiolase, mitochondrial [Sphaeroforma arctica JP610]